MSSDHGEEKLVLEFNLAGKLFAEEALVVSLKDITEQVQAEEALREHTAALENLTEELKKANELLTVIREMDQAILSHFDLQEVMDSVGFRMRDLMRCDRVSIALYMPEQEEVEVVNVVSDRVTQLKSGVRFSLKATSGIREVLETGAVYYSRDLSTLEHPSPVEEHLQAEGIRSYVVFPLRARDRMIGTLNFGSFQTDGFTEEDVKAGEDLADQLAIVVDSSRLFEETHRARREWEHTFDAIGDGVSIQDVEFNVIRANRAFAEIVGKPFKEVIGEKCYHLVHGTDCPVELCPVQVSLRTGEPAHEEFYESALSRWIRVSAYPISEENGGRARYVHVVRDITERKEREAHEAELERHLNRAQRLESIGTLVGGIAHDFNNLLTGMMGYAQLMLMDLDRSDPRYGDLQRIEDSSRRASDLVRQLLTFSRQEKGKSRVMDLNTTMDNTMTLLRRMIPENIAIEVKKAPDLFPVMADPVQMEQVLMNLCVNAKDAMPEGGTLTVETANVRLSEEDCRPYPGRVPGAYVRLSVADTGIGMDEATQQRVFDPFFTTKEVGEGTGLGLATVYGIVQGHQGMVDLRSRVGEGTVFYVYLPAMEEEVEEVGPLEHMAAPGGHETVLLVEDGESVLNLGRRALERYGYRVYIARDGEEALDVYREHRDEVALVISDAVMPKMGARELLARLQEMDPKMKMLVVSGYRQDAEMEGTAGFVQKPYAIPELLRRVREALDRG